MEQEHMGKRADKESWKILYFTKLGRRLRSDFVTSNK